MDVRVTGHGWNASPVFIFQTRKTFPAYKIISEVSETRSPVTTSCNSQPPRVMASGVWVTVPVWIGVQYFFYLVLVCMLAQHSSSISSFIHKFLSIWTPHLLQPDSRHNILSQKNAEPKVTWERQPPKTQGLQDTMRSDFCPLSLWLLTLLLSWGQREDCPLHG